MTSPAHDHPPERPWQGVFAILCTPFAEDGALDLASLRREIHFCLEAGVHGLVGLVNASEYWTLSDEERRSVTEVTVEEVAGAVPLVIGVTAGSAAWAVTFARHAQDSGADAVMAMPPSGRPVGEAEIYRYYEQLSGVLRIPLFVQNHDAPLGTRMAPALVARLVRELPHVDWIKEETLPAGHAISQEIAAAGPKLKGVMGGIAGRYLFDEHARGSCGTMPACESADVHSRIWNLLAAGSTLEARALFSRLLPLLNYEAVSPGVYKTILCWRGVIATDYLRTNLANPLDHHDREELATILGGLGDDFALAPPRPDRAG